MLYPKPFYVSLYPYYLVSLFGLTVSCLYTFHSNPVSTLTFYILRMSSPSRVVELIFEVLCDQTQWGEVVVAVGSTRELGQWRVSQGAFLSTQKGAYPRWRSATIPFTQSDAIEFKFAMAKKGDEGSARWEQSG